MGSEPLEEWGKPRMACPGKWKHGLESAVPVTNFDTKIMFWECWVLKQIAFPLNLQKRIDPLQRQSNPEKRLLVQNEPFDLFFFRSMLDQIAEPATPN